MTGCVAPPAEYRLAGHIKEARTSNRSNHRLRWIRSLLERDMAPTVTVLARVPAGALAATEIAYITAARHRESIERQLAKHRKPPDVPHGNAGRAKSAEHRAKLAASVRAHYADKPGRVHSDETREKMRAAWALRKERQRPV